MRILFVADGRSPIARNWITYFIERRDEVHLVSTFDCTPYENFDSVSIVPIAFSQLKKADKKDPNPTDRPGVIWGSSLVNFRTSIRRFLSPLTIPRAVRQLKEIITELNPDLIHALRIPFEGILAAKALQGVEGIPLLISVWGNDFTLHARSTPWMSRYTSLALTRADGLHTDCYRDLRLAKKWGFSDEKPALVVPGNGGINTDLFYQSNKGTSSYNGMVINPRGVRSYIRNDTFFASIPQILAKHPGMKFVCPGMAGEVEVQNWIIKYGIEQSVILLPNQSRSEMASLFRQALVAVSPSTHDGTPNTLLEAMACGSYPVASDLDSIREWITPGENGSLFDPSDPQALAIAVNNVLANPDLRLQAARINQKIINERADYQTSMARAVELYKAVMGKN